VGLPVGGRTAPLVGRHHELELLRGLLEVARQGSGRVVGVVGEAGIGKSRLVSEFRGGLFRRGRALLETYCLSQGSAIPYFPVRGLLRLIFGLGETDDAASVAEKVGAGVRALGLQPESALPWLLQLLDAGAGGEVPQDLTPEALQARTFEVLRTSRSRPAGRRRCSWWWRTRTGSIGRRRRSSPAWRGHLRRADPLLFTYRPGYRPTWIGSPQRHPDRAVTVVAGREPERGARG